MAEATNNKGSMDFISAIANMVGSIFTAASNVNVAKYSMRMQKEQIAADAATRSDEANMARLSYLADANKSETNLLTYAMAGGILVMLLIVFIKK